MRRYLSVPTGIAVAAAVWPLLVIHAAWLWSLHLQLIPACNPYWEGCTSISAAARNEPVLYFFRGTMLPYGWLLVAYWSLCAAWVAQLHPAARRRRCIMWVCGVTGAMFYLLYATFLGEDGELSRLLRRYGINLYFSMTVLAQMWLISIVSATGILSSGLRRAFIAVLAALLLLGLGSLPLQFLEAVDRRAWLNALEWVYALLMVACYPLTAIAFAQTGFVLRSAVGKGVRPG